MGQLLSDGNADSQQQNDKEILKEICATLGLSEEYLKLCKHPTDITKTCRAIIRKVYPNKSERAKQSIALMGKKRVAAIRGVEYEDSEGKYASRYIKNIY